MQRDVEEVLEAVWSDAEAARSGDEGEKKHLDRLLLEPGIPEALKMAIAEGLLGPAKGSYEFSILGEEQARSIVRRHRLAERLLHDVLDLGMEEVEEVACRFEHVISAEAASSVCTMLGHPSTCPHGKPIPRGECCSEGAPRMRSLVFPATQLRSGELAEVCYVGTQRVDRLTRLAALGVLPGSRLTLRQRWPSYVLQVDEIEMGLDDDVVAEIYVRCSH